MAENEEVVVGVPENDEKLKIYEYSAAASKFESVVDYDTKLSNFEGPLDLLLFLVNRAEIEIKDIFVSQVTEQFIYYINNATDMDMEKESEYLAIAAALLEAKSKSLLPPPIEFEEDFDVIEDPPDIIIQLEEYKLIKEASLKLKEIETTNRFYKNPDDSANDVRIIYKDFNLDGLINAFKDLLVRSDLERRIKSEHKEIPKEIYTVADKVNYIRTKLLEKESCSFFELFPETAPKVEIITTFQAMLELLKRQYLTVEQSEIYGDITINLREDRSEDIGDFSEYN